MSDDLWQPVMKSADLRKKPRRITLEGQEIVLYRTETGIAALRDMCPHRAASLSRGRLHGDRIACPYHGWQFDPTGRCTHIPLHDGPLPQRRVRAWQAQEAHGLIFLTRNAEEAGSIPAPVWDGQPKVERILEIRAEATLADAVENVLDPIHTLFVHRGLIRSGGGASRVTIRAGLEKGALVMHYQGEAKQDGLLSRLLEGERSHAISRFERPGVVSLQYWGPKQLNLVTTLYFTRESDERLRGFAVMTGPLQRGFGWIKALAFVPMMRIVIGQDLRIMQDATTNWRAAGRPPHASSPLDLLRPLIEAVIAGSAETTEPGELQLML